MPAKNRKVKFLSYDQISEEAKRIRNDFKYESIIPVPIEKIIDNDIKINIIPFLDYKRIQYYYSAMLARVIIAKNDLPRISINFFVYSDIPRTAESEKISL